MKRAPTERGPDEKLIKTQAAAGYITAAAVVDLVKERSGRTISLDTVYRWARKWRPTEAKPFGETLDGKFKAYRGGATTWFLRAAILDMTKIEAQVRGRA